MCQRINKTKIVYLYYYYYYYYKITYSLPHSSLFLLAMQYVSAQFDRYLLTVTKKRQHCSIKYYLSEKCHHCLRIVEEPVLWAIGI